MRRNERACQEAFCLVELRVGFPAAPQKKAGQAEKAWPVSVE